MTPAQLKTQFDSSPEELRVSLNGLIDALMNALAGTSGAEQIGAAPIAGVNGSTPYAQLVDLKSQLSGLVLGQIPDASLTLQKLSQALQTSSIGGQIYAYKNIGGAL